MEELCNRTLQLLRQPAEDDPIKQCRTELLESLISCPESQLILANEKLHIFPFKDVKECWKRLYTDASISKAVSTIKAHIASSGHARRLSEVWITEVVKTLDMALIMAGGLRREGMIEELFIALQQHVNDSLHSRKRKRTDNDVFPVESYRSPELEFPIRRSSLSLSEFKHYLEKPSPIVITGALADWPAMQKQAWRRPSYLLEKTFDGRRLVPIELGRSYTDEDFRQVIIPFKDFMTNFLLTPNCETISYLAQHDLFSQIPALRKDIKTPEFCSTSPPPPPAGTPLANQNIPHLEHPLVKAWLGPPGTISPLHTDPYHNILCQVLGKKYIRLYSPWETANMYPRGITEDGIEMSNTSRIEPEQVEMMNVEDEDDSESALFPLFPQARYVETILHEGECLYIPVGWWHYVRSLTTSFGVSFWWN